MYTSWPLLPLLLFTTTASLVSAADDPPPPFDCKWSEGNLKWDLTSLKEATLTRTRNTPPSTSLDTLRIDLCKDLTPLPDVADRDQCPTGTRACLTTMNKKEEDGKDRIVHVVAVGVSSVPPELKVLPATVNEGRGLSITLHGNKYDDQDQSVHISLLCSTTVTPPKFMPSIGSVTQVEWSAPAGCDFEGDKPPPAEGGDQDSGHGEEGSSGSEVGSGIGWFFLVLLLAFVAYLGLGAYYNYSTYGSTGLDLIPHRDFWKEVPYMLQDVVSHLCSAVRPRRQNRTGYMAV